MDVGQLNNPFSSSAASKPKEDKTSHPNAQKTGSGLLKIGDYDEPKSSKNPHLTKQAAQTVSEGVQSMTNKLSGNDGSK
jgi:hypothetical protein